MYPKMVPDSADESEKRVYEALTTLGDDWVVIHDVRFVVPPRGKQPARNGQADFVLINPKQGLLILEAKGGGYEVRDGTWLTFPGGIPTQMDRGPFAQATSNRYAITNYIADASGLRGLPAGHAVVFTDGAPRGSLGPEAPGAIIIDGSHCRKYQSQTRRGGRNESNR